VELQLYSFHLGASVPELKPQCPCELSVLGEGSQAEVSLLPPFVATSVAGARFSRGEVCFAWLRGSEVLSNVWASCSPERVEEILQIVRPRSGEIYLFDAFTAPPYRGLGLYASLLSAALRHYRDRGLKRALIFTTSENVSSWKGILRAGFSLFQVIRYWKVMRLCIYWEGPVLTALDTDALLEPWC